MRGEDFMFWSIWMVMTLGGIFIILHAMTKRQRIAEMAHKERLAMIERGLVPPPHMATPGMSTLSAPSSSANPRARLLSGGIVVIAFGVGLLLLIGVTGGAPEAAFGIGGAIAVLGFALIGIALVQAPPVHAAPMMPPMPPPPAPRPDDRFPSA